MAVPADPTKYLRDIRIHTEYSALAAARIGGLYILPDPDDILLLHGVVFPRQSSYAGGVFKFTITLPQTYPSGTPSVTFLTRVFSPLVNPEVSRCARVPAGLLSSYDIDVAVCFYARFQCRAAALFLLHCWRLSSL